MTDNELRELREWAAKVCGKDCFYGDDGSIMVNCGNLDDFAIPVESWLPDQNIAQALEVLDSVRKDDYEIGSCGHGKQHYCCIYGEPRVVCEHESRAMAIMLACREVK